MNAGLDIEMDRLLGEMFNRWADEGRLAPERSAHLADLIRRQARREARRRWLIWPPGAVAAITALFLLVVAVSPAARAWAVDNLPVVGKYLARWSEIEKGWSWSEKHGMFQEIVAASPDHGYTLRVHRVLADPTQTTVIYTVEGNLASGTLPPASPQRVEFRFNGQRFGFHMGGRGEVIDGVRVGSLEFDPLPGESGELEMTVRQIGEVEGLWNVSFPVIRSPLAGNMRTVEIGKTLSIAGGGKLLVERLLLTPIQTVVLLRYEGEIQGPQDPGQGSRLLAGGKPVQFRGSSSSGKPGQDGIWRQAYELRFQPLETVPNTLVLRLASLIYQPGETRVPLVEGESAPAPDGRMVGVDSLTVTGTWGRASISYPTERENPWPFEITDWEVLDDAGRLNRTFPLGQEQSTGAVKFSGEKSSGDAWLSLQWQLAPGRKAVALVNPGYWTYEDHLGEISIAITAE